MNRRQIWWLLLPIALLALFIFLRLGNGFDERSGHVHISYDENGYHFNRDGKPFFVKGAAGSGHVSELQASGGNTIRIYQPDSLSGVLAAADSLGIAVIADLPLPIYRDNGKFYGEGLVMDSIIATVRDVVIKHRDHPALLCWILGNEINFTNGDAAFRNDYRRLLDTIRRYDPNHPIGTTVVFHQLVGMHLSPRNTMLDFIGINTFGSLTEFEQRKQILSIAWTGPYLISEWGTNGPWEADYNQWNAPIEQSSYYKARQLRERYAQHLDNTSDGRMLGHLAFYWGQKQERTPTWFSLFSRAGLKTQSVHELGNLWRNEQVAYNGIAIDYLLIGGFGAADSPVFKPGDTTNVIATYHHLPEELTRLKWALVPEVWYNRDTVSVKVDLSDSLIIRSSVEWAHLVIPERPGPYRVALYAADTLGYVATANLPFFVLAKPDYD